MSDNKKTVGNPDRLRINLSENYEVQDWSKKFGVSADELREAVKAVGNNAKDVEKFINSQTRK